MLNLLMALALWGAAALAADPESEPKPASNPTDDRVEPAPVPDEGPPAPDADEPAAPAAETQEPILTESAAPRSPAPDPQDSGGLRLRIGVHVGPTIPMSKLGPGVRPRAEVVLSAETGSVEIGGFVTGAIAGLRQTGEGSDPQLAAGTYSWELRQREISLALGAFLRLDEVAWGLHPELLVAPQWYVLRTRSDGESGGEPFGRSEESWSTFGIMVATGLSRELGPGEIAARLEWTMAPMNSIQTGDSHLSSIAPTLGYRLVF